MKQNSNEVLALENGKVRKAKIGIDIGGSHIAVRNNRK